jgi:hypothetical protein
VQVLSGQMVPLGYGKYFRSDSILGLEPIEEDRGPGRRTRVYVDACDDPLIASRSDDAILRDLTGAPREMARGREQYQLLSDILDTVSEINPVLRSIIRDQGKWDLGRLEERIRNVLSDAEQEA